MVLHAIRVVAFYLTIMLREHMIEVYKIFVW